MGVNTLTMKIITEAMTIIAETPYHNRSYTILECGLRDCIQFATDLQSRSPTLKNLQGANPVRKQIASSNYP